MMQSLGNKTAHSKEAYMDRLGPFCEENEERFNKFLNDLCEVGDFKEDLEVNHTFMFRWNNMLLYRKGKSNVA
jgi:Ras GTPase-activating-like protein IQGAP2/3